MRIYPWIIVAIFATGCGSPAGLGSDDLSGEPVESQSEPLSAFDGVARPNQNTFLNRGQTRGPTGNWCPTAAKPCADTTTGLVLPDGIAQAKTYYGDTNQNYDSNGDGAYTLTEWMQAFNFPVRYANESLHDFRKRTNIVVYYNAIELGLGRELGCSINGTKIGCFVTNYGTSFNDATTTTELVGSYAMSAPRSLMDAIQGRNVKNTVVISFNDSLPPWQRVQFAAFGEDGKRINKAQLDTMGSRSVPQICLSCHGGIWYNRDQNNAATPLRAWRSHFLPLNPDVVAFASGNSNSQYTRANQLEAIRANNEYGTKYNNELLNAVQRDYMKSMYNWTQLSSETFNIGSLKYETLGGVSRVATMGPVSGSAHPDWAWNAGSTEEKKFFSYVLNPSCGTCHWALADTINRANCHSCHPSYADSSFTDGKTLWDWSSGNWQANMRNATMLMATRAFTKKDDFWVGPTQYVGHFGYIDRSVGITCRDSVGCMSGSRSTLVMPNAQPTFNRFWGETPSPSQSLGPVPIANYGQWWLVFGSAYSDMGGLNSELYWFGPSETLTFVSNPSTLQCTSDADCGQGYAAGKSSDGTDSGRRCLPVANPPSGQSSYKTCQDGASDPPPVHCSGMEKDHAESGSYDGQGGGSVGPNFTVQARLRGDREESTGGGTCFRCGRIGQPVCFYASPRCHEGRPSGSAIDSTCEPVELIKLRPSSNITASPSFESGNNGSNLIDGNDGTAALTQNASSGTLTSAKITVDLGIDRTFQRIRLVERNFCRNRMDYAHVRIKTASGAVVVDRQLDQISDDVPLYKDVDFVGAGGNYPVGRKIEIEQTNNVNCNSKNYPIVQLGTMEVWGWNAPMACDPAFPDCVITGQ